MNASIDVDIGGTFTDCFVNIDGQHLFAKSPTTGYDLSSGFIKALGGALSNVDSSMEEVLKNTEIVRYSTTIAMNTLLQRTGPKLGLLCTEAVVDTVARGRSASWSDGLSMDEWRNQSTIRKPEPLIPYEMTVGVKERIDSQGMVIRPLDEDYLLEKIQYLVDKGATGFVVSLLFSYLNPVHERRIKEIITTEYPSSFLGSMPVIISSDVCPKRLEYTRTMTTILNAYLHYSMQDQLSGLGNQLRDRGYKRAIMMVHNTGGMADVFHTTAVQTYNGGPVSGLIGAVHQGKILGHENIVNTDMGGTSFDLGMIIKGTSRFYAWKPVIDRWWVDATMLETKSIGAGGGSIAWINPIMGNRLDVGPKSAGSMPGPVAYDLGGEEATVTDADIVLGYINPDYYHGGRMTLNKDAATLAIEQRLAKPLGIRVEEAALLVKMVVDAAMAEIITKETLLKGYNPADFILFANGGAGPTHACGYGFRSGIRKIVISPYSPYSCAFGSAGMDVVHIYEQSVRIPLIAAQSKQYLKDYEEFNKVVRSLQEKALRDVTGQGFSVESVVFDLEMEAKFGGQIHICRTSCPRLALESEDDCKAIYQQFERDYSEQYSRLSVFPEGGVEIHSIILRATIPVPKLEVSEHPLLGENPDQALKEHRLVYWETTEFMKTPIYAQSLLGNGNVVLGPAIVEAESTTTVIPGGVRATVDSYHNLVLEQV